MNALDWNRDLRLSCAEIRQRETDAGMTDKGRGCNTVSFAELRRGSGSQFHPRVVRAFCELIDGLKLKHVPYNIVARMREESDER